MNRHLRALTEGAIFTALAMVLSYLEIPIGLSFGGFGGSISFVMLPIVLYAVRWGAARGVIVALVFGMLKYFFSNGWAVSWVSIIFDYALAYAAVGLAGITCRRKNGLIFGGLIGAFARFIIHFISGVTVYAQYMPDEFLNLPMTSPVIYSILYNGTYMLPNTVILVVLCVALTYPLRKYITGNDISNYFEK